MKIRLAAALRVLGFVLGGGVAVVAALALLVWISFDAGRTADELARHFKDRYQRTLTLGADPQLRMWPRPALVLNQVSLSEAGRADTFATAEQIRLDLALWPLLLRQPEVRRVRLNGLEVQVKRSAKGDWNFASLLAEPPSDAPTLPWRIHVGEIRVGDARMHLDDARGNYKAEWQDVTVLARDLDTDGSGTLDWQGQWRGSGDDTDFRFSGTTRFVLGERLSAGSLEGLKLRLEGNGRGLKGATAEMSSASLNWSDGGTAGKLADIRVKVQGALGKQALNGTGRAAQLGWQEQRVQGDKLEGQLALRELGIVTEFDAHAAKLQEMPTGFSGDALELVWKHQNGKDKGSDGKLSARLEANLQTGTYRIDGLAGQISLRHPGLNAGSARVDVSGKFGWRTDGRADGVLLGQIGTDKLQVNAALQKLWPAQGTLDVTSSSLDVDRLLASSGDRKNVFGIPALDDLALKGKVQLNGLHAAGMHIDSLLLPYTIEDGDFDAEGATVALYGGQIAGGLSVQSDNGQLDVEGDFRDLQFDRLSKDAALQIPLGGRASGTYRLATRIHSEQDPWTALNGAVRWQLSNATLHGADLLRSMHALRPAIESGKQSARTTAAGEVTELGTAGSRFVFANGMMQAEGLQTRSAALVLNGGGSASLLRDELDFNLVASLQPGIANTPEKDLLALRSKPIALRLKGPRLHPDVRYEPGTAPPVLTPAKVAGVVKKK